MADLEELTGEEAHVKALLDAGITDADTPVETVEEPKVEEKQEVAEEPAAEPVEETKAEVAAAEEYFPGYANLPEESKKLVRESMERAAQAEEYRQIAGKAEADRRATVGKIAPLQREYEKARLRLKEIEQNQSTSTRAETRTALEEFAKDYPDEAKHLLAINQNFESFREQSEKEKEELLQRLEAIENGFGLQKQEFESIRQREAEVATLAKEHPDYLEIDADPQWQAWLQAMKGVEIVDGKDVYALLRNGKASSTAFVLSNFKRDRDYAQLLQGQTATPSTPAQKPLARSVADPNPTSRQPTAVPRSNMTAGLDGEERHLALLREAGIDV